MSPFPPSRPASLGIAGFDASGHLPSAQDLDLLGRLGARSLSIGFSLPEDPSLASDSQLDTLAQVAAAVHERGLETLIVLEGAWQAPGFAAAAGKTVRRLKDAVHHWEVLREPDAIPQLSDDPGLRRYAALCQSVSHAVKAEDPRGILHSGGLGPALPRSLRTLYAAGAGAAFDIVDLHLWMNPLMPDAFGGLRYFFDTIRSVLEQNGDGGKPLWLSEAGCPGVGGELPARPDWPLGKNPTEKVQAEWARIQAEKVVAWPGVERVFWCCLRDGGTLHPESGLLRRDGTPKPAFETLERIAERRKPSEAPA